MVKYKSVPKWYMTTWGFKKIRNKPYYRYVQQLRGGDKLSLLVVAGLPLCPPNTKFFAHPLLPALQEPGPPLRG